MPMTIGELAGAADVNVQTVRYYERRGIIAEPARTGSGYRQYGPNTIHRIKFIKRAQGLGFTLAEIEELLALRVEDADACPAIEAKARSKLAQVEGKIRELDRLRRVLHGLVDACRERRPTAECPILETLEADSPGAAS